MVIITIRMVITNEVGDEESSMKVSPVPLSLVDQAHFVLTTGVG